MKNKQSPAKQVFVLTRNDASVQGRPRLEVLAAADGTHQINLVGPIGKSWWDVSGVSAAEFREALAVIPEDAPIDLRIDSEGGSVREGLNIYNEIAAVRDRVTATVVGYAASIASVIPLAAKKVISPDAAMWMVHRAWSFEAGDADDMASAAESLREHDELLLDIYTTHTGKSRDEWRKWMDAETWIRGSRAVEFGLATETAEPTPDEEVETLSARIRGLPEKFLQRCKNAPLNLIASPKKQGEENQNQKPKENKMNEEKALPNAGEKNNGNAIAPQAVIGVENLEQRFKAFEKRAELRGEIKALVAAEKITQAQADRVLAMDSSTWEAQVEILRENPVRPKAAEDVGRISVEFNDASPVEIDREVSRNNKAQLSLIRNGSAKEAGAMALRTAAVIARHRQKVDGIMNANTIGSGLARSVILQDATTAFAAAIAPVTAFTYVAGNVTDAATVTVPHYPLVTTSVDWNAGNGYVAGDVTVSDGTITLNKRKYRAVKLSTSELTKNPALQNHQFVNQMAQLIGNDVVADVLTLVTNANYGSAVFTGAAATFDEDDVIDLSATANAASWPEVLRGLFLTSAYDANLRKNLSPGFWNLSRTGDDKFDRSKFPLIQGFTYYGAVAIPANSENLVGFMCIPQAIGFAQCPMVPRVAVMSALADYQIAIDPRSGFSLEYRLWGDAQLDSQFEVIEANYGYAARDTTALKRIVSA